MYKRHKGDDLLKEDLRLKYKWDWSRIASGYTKKQLDSWTHFQSSEAKIKGWTLEVSQRGGDDKYYSAQIEYIGEHIASDGRGFEDTKYKTRVEAQIAAERLLIVWITSQYNEVVINRGEG